MAHLIEKMAFVGETPWHGLGQNLSAGATLETWLKESGLDWSVRAAPVRYQTSVESALQLWDEKSVLFRSDTGAPLGLASNRYQIVQPHAVMEFYRNMTEALGYTLETAGSLSGGRKIWALAKTPLEVERANDRLKGYVLLATSFDGTLATTAQATTIRVVCNNTLSLSISHDGKNNAVKIPHSTKFNAQRVQQQLGIGQGFADFETFFEQSAQTGVNARDISRIVRATLGLETDEQAATSKRSIEQIVQAIVTSPGSALKTARGTAWGALNGVTYYADHCLGRTPDTRLSSAWFGRGALMKQRAFAEVMEILNEQNTPVKNDASKLVAVDSIFSSLATA